MEKIMFVKKLQAKRQNSFWYHGFGEIAKFAESDREIIISVCGDIRVQVEMCEGFLKNEQAVDKALKLNLFDTEIKKLNFDENNWFDFLYKNSKMDKWEDIEDDERFTYSSAMKAAKEYLADNDFWNQF